MKIIKAYITTPFFDKDDKEVDLINLLTDIVSPENEHDKLIINFMTPRDKAKAYIIKHFDINPKDVVIFERITYK